MTGAPKDDETKFNETLKRMLESPPKPHKKESGDGKGPALRPAATVEGTGNKDARPRPKRKN